MKQYHNVPKCLLLEITIIRTDKQQTRFANNNGVNF